MKFCLPFLVIIAKGLYPASLVKVTYSLQLLHCEGTNNGTGTATKKNNKRGYLANVRFNVLKH